MVDGTVGGVVIYTCNIHWITTHLAIKTANPELSEIIEYNQHYMFVYHQYNIINLERNLYNKIKPESQFKRDTEVDFFVHISCQ